MVQLLIVTVVVVVLLLLLPIFGGDDMNSSRFVRSARTHLSSRPSSLLTPTPAIPPIVAAAAALGASRRVTVGRGGERGVHADADDASTHARSVLESTIVT